MRWFVLCLCGCFFPFIALANTKSIGYEYLNTKYMTSPLGEANGYDSDPLIRFDGFDCTTFVETALANGNVNKLNKIRYKNGKIDFKHRNHFIESDWIKNNSDLVENVSAYYGTTSVRSVIINKQSWFKTVHNIDFMCPKDTINLEYLPYSNITEINNIEPLIVLFIVGKPKKTDTIGTDLAVVHMGFLMPGGKTLRHASSEHGYVMDTDFQEYIARRAINKRNIGIVLLGIKNGK